jgi:NADH-quinone oxidoreductase subunit L
MGVSLAVALCGIGLAYLIYYKQVISEEKIIAKVRVLYDIIQNKYFFDEIYQKIFVKPVLMLAGRASAFDQTVVDGAVNQVGWATVKGSEETARFDRTIVDGIVNGIGFLVKAVSERSRKAHTGYLQRYILVIFIGFIVLALVVYVLLR